MSYTKNIKRKKFSWGGEALATYFPTNQLVSIIGSISSPHDKGESEELSYIRAQMLLAGTARHSKKEIQILLDDIGASLELHTSGTRLVFESTVRTHHLETVFLILSELLEKPLFPADELLLLKKRREADLLYEEQNTREQAEIGLSRLLFDSKHPNYKESTTESKIALQKIDQDSLKRYHEKNKNFSSLVLSVAGDIQPKKIFSLTEKYFKRDPITTMSPTKHVTMKSGNAKKVVKNIKNKESIDYMVGTALGITDSHPDFPALLLGVNVLGSYGSFTGRLMKEVREKEGLTYGVYSFLGGFDLDKDGFFVAWGTFAASLFKKGQKAMLREIENILKYGVTEDEVKKHRLMFAGKTRVKLSDSKTLATIVHATILGGKPITYIDALPKKIISITKKEVNNALKKYIKLENLSESAAGPIQKI